MNKTVNNTDVGRRLEEELIRAYGNKRKAAESMGLKDGSYWTTYIKGKNKIGGILQKRLLDAGLDVTYILHGTTRTQTSKSLSKATELERLRLRMKAISKEIDEMSEIIERLLRNQ